jgi:uncharacterized membrane protein (UPF0127 family)
MRYLWVGVGLGLLGLLAVVIFGRQQNPPADQTTKKILIGQTTFTVTTAETASQKERGLAGVSQLNPDQGLYFPIDTQGEPPVFWMKGMLIPIDIIWIDNNRVASIQRNAPPPAANTPDNDLQRYFSPVPEPDGVLEVAANRSSEAGINVGDRVEWLDQ